MNKILNQYMSKAKKDIIDLSKECNNVIVIHYSCESFYKENKEGIPKVVSIAVMGAEDGQIESFSIHDGKTEKQMLEEYHNYIKGKKGYIFLHWKMNNSDKYGFHVLEDRFRELGGKPHEIRDTSKVNLCEKIETIYGNRENLLGLQKSNSIPVKDILGGKEEAELAEKSEYKKVHYSTLDKVDLIKTIFEKIVKGTLKTNSKWYKSLVKKIKDHWIVSLLMGFIGLIAAVITIYNFIFK